MTIFGRNTTLGETVAALSPRLGDRRATGEYAIPRHAAIGTTNAGTSGILYLSYFTAQRTEPISTLHLHSSSTAAGATPTLVKFCAYEEADDGDLTLAGVTANDTGLFAATNTDYPKALTATWHKVRGHRYAVGYLIVTAAAMPQLVGCPMNIGAGVYAAEANRLTGQLSGQTDVPSSIASGDIAASIRAPQVKMVP